MKRLCLTLIAALMLINLSAVAAVPSGTTVSSDKQNKDPTLILTVGKAEVLEVKGPVADILIANATIVDVTAIQSDKLYLVGLNIGDTNVMTLDDEGNVLDRLNVHVRLDTSTIQEMVDRLFPNENVTVDMIHDQLVLTGTVSTPGVANRVINLVAHYYGDVIDEEKTSDELIANMLEVRGEQQVMLRVRIAEISRSILKELGVETSLNDRVEGADFTIFGRSPPGSGETAANNLLAGLVGVNSGTGLTEDPFGQFNLLGDTGVNALGFIDIFLNALEQDNMANILAEPNLTAISGEQAGFLAGGEFPVPIGRDQTGNVVIEYRPFGVSLNFRPKVMSAERISLQLNTEVSSLDFESSVTLAQINVPGLDVRRADTTVELPSGGTLMIGGLLQSDSIKGLSGLPGVMNTPVIGDLIKSDSFQKNETELIVLVTAYLVDPFADRDQVKITKTDIPPLPASALSLPVPPRPADDIGGSYDEMPAVPVAAIEPEANVAAIIPSKKPESFERPLTKAFNRNIHRIYGNRAPDLFTDIDYGYMLD